MLLRYRFNSAEYFHNRYWGHQKLSSVYGRGPRFVALGQVPAAVKISDRG